MPVNARLARTNGTPGRDGPPGHADRRARGGDDEQGPHAVALRDRAREEERRDLDRRGERRGQADVRGIAAKLEQVQAEEGVAGHVAEERERDREQRERQAGCPPEQAERGEDRGPPAPATVARAVRGSRHVREAERHRGEREPADADEQQRRAEPGRGVDDAAGQRRERIGEARDQAQPRIAAAVVDRVDHDRVDQRQPGGDEQRPGEEQRRDEDRRRDELDRGEQQPAGRTGDRERLRPPEPRVGELPPERDGDDVPDGGEAGDDPDRRDIEALRRQRDGDERVVDAERDPDDPGRRAEAEPGDRGPTADGPGAAASPGGVERPDPIRPMVPAAVDGSGHDRLEPVERHVDRLARIDGLLPGGLGQRVAREVGGEVVARGGREVADGDLERAVLAEHEALDRLDLGSRLEQVADHLALAEQVRRRVERVLLGVDHGDELPELERRRDAGHDLGVVGAEHRSGEHAGPEALRPGAVEDVVLEPLPLLLAAVEELVLRRRVRVVEGVEVGLHRDLAGRVLAGGRRVPVGILAPDHVAAVDRLAREVGRRELGLERDPRVLEPLVVRALDADGVGAVDVDGGHDGLSQRRGELDPEVGVPQLVGVLRRRVGRLREPAGLLGRDPRPWRLDAAAEERRVVALAALEGGGRVDAVGQRLRRRRDRDRHRDRPVPPQQRLERADADRAVVHAVGAREVEPDDAATVEPDERRPGVAAQAGAVVLQDAGVPGRLHDQPRGEALDVVQAAEVAGHHAQVVARVEGRVPDERDEVVRGRLGGRQPDGGGQVGALDPQQGDVGRRVVGEVQDVDDPDRDRVAGLRVHLLLEVEPGLVQGAARRVAQEHAGAVGHAAAHDLRHVPVRRDDPRGPGAVDDPAGPAPRHVVVHELDAAHGPDRRLDALDQRVGARGEVGQRLQLDDVVAHDERRPADLADDRLQRVEGRRRSRAGRRRPSRSRRRRGTARW